MWRCFFIFIICLGLVMPADACAKMFHPDPASNISWMEKGRDSLGARAVDIHETNDGGYLAAGWTRQQEGNLTGHAPDGIATEPLLFRLSSPIPSATATMVTPGENQPGSPAGHDPVNVSQPESGTTPATTSVPDTTLPIFLPCLAVGCIALGAILAGNRRH